jgi:glycosyltransferase involved in cell wall biosynthesis
MCRALSDRGMRVLIAATDDGLDNASELKQGQTINYKGFPVILFPKQLGASFKYSRPFSLWLHANVTNFDVVHIHAVFNHASIAAARACRKKRVPYIVRPLGTLDPWSMKQKPLRKKVFWHAGVQKMLTGAAAIHYTSDEEQRAVEESLNLNHGVVVPLGVDSKRVVPESRAPQERPYVLVLSRLHPKKALAVLIEAFLSLIVLEEFESWSLVLAGDGPADYVASLKRIVERQHATEFVKFPGWLSDEKREAALGNASLLALPSYQENFGLCVMESLAHGVPVLISPHVNLAGAIESAGAGWIAAVDKNSLQKVLAEALRSEDERRRRGTAGRSLASKFSWPAVAASLCELYGSILKHRKSPSQI